MQISLTQFKKSVLYILLASIICFSNITTSFADTNNTAVVSTETNKTTEYKWVSKKGQCYCYKNGKKLKNGIFTINNKKYYFDKNGKQKIGWRKIGKKNYFFNIKPAEKGYMIKGKTVDGVKLKKNGQASPNTNRAKMKLPMMIEVQKLADSLLDWRLTRTKQLRKAYDFVNTYFHSIGSPNLGNGGDWDILYANSMLSRNGGNCYAHAAIFGYLANALGFKNVLIQNSTGHAWTQIGDKWYDPSYERWYHVDSFAVPRSKCGKDGRINWPVHIVYSNNCDK